MIDYCLPVSIRHHGSTFVPPVDVFWPYRVTVSAGMAVGLLLWLARRSGTTSGQSPRCRCYYR